LQRHKDYANVNAVQFYLGAPPEQTLDAVLNRSTEMAAWQPFDPRATAFVARFSQRMLTHPQARRFPELIALAHWFRGARLKELAGDYPAATGGAIVRGRGLAFHVAPANVDSVFMYSWLLSLLAGNTNIVRVSQKTSPQLEFLIEVLAGVLGEDVGFAVAGRIVLLTYPHDGTITRAISERCMARVVWGGDATVATLRAIALRPTAVEMCFPDRFSVAALKAERVLAATEAELGQLSVNFYNDAFWFAQQACSSPRLINWVGNLHECEAASARFWRAVTAEVARKLPENTGAMGMARLGAAFELAAARIARPELNATELGFPALLRMEQPLDGAVKTLHCGNGLFLQQRLDRLCQLAGQLSDKEQTLSVHGFTRDEVLELVDGLPARALDRVTTIGEALAFAPVWDGIDLIHFFTRRIALPENLR
jgi:hypothetical protein